MHGSVNGSQLAKMKKVHSSNAPAIKIYRVEAVGLLIANYALKTSIFENM